MKISGLSIRNLEEIFKLDFKEWKIQNRQERPRTRDYSVNENSLFGKIYKWFEDEPEKVKAKPAV